MRAVLIAASLLWLAGVGDAAACRYGTDELLVWDLTMPPDTVRFSTIALVNLKVDPSPGSPTPAGWDERGARVGMARVKEVMRGPTLPNEIPVYLAVLTSCSDFVRSHHGYRGDGYVVGRLMTDRHGPYILLAERNDGTREWR